MTDGRAQSEQLVQRKARELADTIISERLSYKRALLERAIFNALAQQPTQAQFEELQRQVDEAMGLAEEAVRQRDAALAQQPASLDGVVRLDKSDVESIMQLLYSASNGKQNIFANTADELRDLLVAATALPQQPSTEGC